MNGLTPGLSEYMDILWNNLYPIRQRLRIDD